MTNCTDEGLADLFDLERAQRNLEVAENAPPESVAIMDTLWVELRMALAKIRLQAKEIVRLKCNCAAIVDAMGRSDPEDMIFGHEPDCVATNDLAKGLRYAVMVNRALPVDHEMDHQANAALAKHAAEREQRKLAPKHTASDGCVAEVCRLLEEWDNPAKAGEVMGEHLKAMGLALKLGRETAPDPERNVGRRPSKSMGAKKKRRP